MPRPVLPAALVAVLLLVLSCSAQAQPSASHGLPKNASPSTTIVLFGVQGGNIRPWSIAFKYDGSVESNGWQHPRKKLADPKHTLQAILKLARAERFFKMPTQTNCSGTLPDIAAVYIAITTTSGTKTVTVHGSCNARFRQLTDVLFQIAGIE